MPPSWSRMAVSNLPRIERRRSRIAGWVYSGQAVADTFTPLQWEQYVPYDRAKSGGR